MTPLFSHNELAEAGVKIVLHPLSAFRAMSKAAEKVYATLASGGDHEGLLDQEVHNWHWLLHHQRDKLLL